MRESRTRKRTAGILGVACDANDGQKRITRGKNFLILGGSQETHDFMRETVVKINERIAHAGRSLEDYSVQELREVVREITE